MPLHMLLALLPAGSALACSCLPSPPPQEALAQSRAVFRGIPIAQTRPDAEANAIEVGFVVSEIWKGPRDPLQGVITTDSSAACGIDFQPRTEYLVYVGESGMSTLCSRTAPAADATADIAALGSGQPPQAATAEDTVRHARFDGGWFNPDRDGEGLLIDVLDDGRAAVYWFGYRPGTAPAQAWLHGVGEFVGHTLHVAEVSQPVGGGFGDAYNAAAVERVVWGELTVQFDQDGGASVQWRSRLAEYGSGELVLQRLSRPPRVRPATD
jgi:hypothetical protein